MQAVGVDDCQIPGLKGNLLGVGYRCSAPLDTVEKFRGFMPVQIPVARTVFQRVQGKEKGKIGVRVRISFVFVIIHKRPVLSVSDSLAK